MPRITVDEIKNEKVKMKEGLSFQNMFMLEFQKIML